MATSSPASRTATETPIRIRLSPDGRYCAEVLDHDEGALGGSTGLYVYRIPGTFSVGSFSFRRDYEEVARGDWNTFESLQWQDETHVVYNGRVYEIVP